MVTPPGRPRDATRDGVIHQATLELLVQRGYDRLSIDAVAARAGVSKATIYRRYRDKAAMVAAAVEHRGAAEPPHTAGLSLREALVATLGWLADQVSSQDAGLLGAAVAGVRGEPALAEAMQRVLQRDQAVMVERALGRAIADGAPLVAGAAQLFAEVAPAVVVHRVLFSGLPCDQPFVEHLVDDVLLPLLRRPPDPTSP